jgi:hypothetical protein
MRQLHDTLARRTRRGTSHALVGWAHSKPQRASAVTPHRRAAGRQDRGDRRDGDGRRAHVRRARAQSVRDALHRDSARPHPQGAPSFLYFDYTAVLAAGRLRFGLNLQRAGDAAACCIGQNACAAHIFRSSPPACASGVASSGTLLTEARFEVAHAGWQQVLLIWHPGAPPPHTQAHTFRVSATGHTLRAGGRRVHHV